MAFTPLLCCVPAVAQNAGPVPMQPAGEWIEAIRMLSAQIVVSLRASSAVLISVKNMSELDEGTVAVLRRELEDELRARGVRLGPDVGGGTSLEIDFSQSAETYLLIARTGTESADAVNIVAGPARGSRVGSTEKQSLVLVRKAIWRQAEPFLDFQEILPGSAGESAALLILSRDALRFYRQSDLRRWMPDQLVSTPRSTPWPRDMRGWIDMNAKRVELSGVECAAEFSRPRSLQCNTAAEAKFPQELSEMPVAAAAVGGLKREIGDGVLLDDECNGGRVALATGAGDWTQPDSLQAFELRDGALIESGDPLAFAGPVLALWPSNDLKAARVVWRNLQTGMYEASFVSVTCGN